MSFQLTVTAEDWSAVGASPAHGFLEIGLLRPVLGDTITTDKTWEARLLADGTGSWEIPTVPADNALKVRSRVDGLYAGKTFYFANPGVGSHSLTELIEDWQVDPKTLQPSAEAVAGWTAAVAATSTNAASADASADAAQVSADDAETARLGALGYRTEALTARDDARTARDDAAGSASTAATSAAQAGSYATAQDTAIAGLVTGSTATRAALSATIATEVPDASTTVKGRVELATTTETQTGTDTTRAVTPAAAAATFARSGTTRYIQSITLDSPTDVFADTSRLRIISHQKQEPENSWNGGETIWFDIDSRAKAMLTWRLGFDETSRLPYPISTVLGAAHYHRVAWAGAHYYAQDQVDDNNPTDIHGHWSVEVPDVNGDLRTRFEIPFVENKTSGLIGTDKTNIQTLFADFTVRAEPRLSNGTPGRLRLAGRDDDGTGTYGYDKVIEFSSHFDGYDVTGKRIELVMTKKFESGTNQGSNFGIRLYDDTGTFIWNAFAINRKRGHVSFGGDPDTLYSGHVHATWNESGYNGFLAQPSVAVSGGAAYAAIMTSTTERAFQAQVANDGGWRFMVTATGIHEWGNGLSAARDTNLYRKSPDLLATDDDFELATTGKGVIIKSPDGTRYKVTVANGGALTTAVAP